MIHPIHVSQRKKQMLDGASERLMKGKKSKEKEKGQTKEAKLFQQINKLQMEFEWLKKISTTQTPRKCASCWFQATLSSV